MAITIMETTSDLGSITIKNPKSSYSPGDSVSITFSSVSGYGLYSFTLSQLNITQRPSGSSHTFTIPQDFTGDTITIIGDWRQYHTITKEVVTSPNGVEPGGSLTISKMSSVMYGDEISITPGIVDTDRYTFDGVKRSDATHSNTDVSAPVNNITKIYDISSDTKFTAYFTAKNKTITLRGDGNSTPSFSGGGTSKTVPSSTEVTFSANPSTGYVFNNWTCVRSYYSLTGALQEDTVTVNTETVSNYKVYRNETWTASYSKMECTLTVTDDGNGTASISGKTGSSAKYEYGTNVTISATPITGYEFVRWQVEGGFISPLSITDNPYSFEVTGSSVTAKAIFGKQQCSVSVGTGGNGTVYIGNNTSTTTVTVNYGTSVTAKATANSGHRFSKWTVNGNTVSTNVTYTFTATENVALVASFVQLYSVTVQRSPGNTPSGIVHVSPLSAAQGETISISCDTIDGFDFSYIELQWNGGTTEKVYSQSTTVTMGATDLTVIGRYAEHVDPDPTTYTVNASAYSTSHGSVYPTTKTGTEGSTVQFTATPNSGYRFTYWMVNGTQIYGNPLTYTFTSASNQIVVAHFTPSSSGSGTGTSYNLRVNIGNSTVTVNGDVYDSSIYVAAGSTITLVATPDPGYTFDSWSVSGTPSFSIDGNRCSLVMMEGNVTVTVNTTATGEDPTQSGEDPTQSGEDPTQSGEDPTPTPEDPGTVTTNGYSIYYWNETTWIPIMVSTT